MNASRLLASIAIKTTHKQLESYCFYRSQAALQAKGLHTTRFARNSDNEEDTIDLDSIFKLLETPPQKDQNRPSDTAGKPRKDKLAADCQLSSSKNTKDGEDDLDIDDFFKSFTNEKKPQADKPKASYQPRNSKGVKDDEDELDIDDFFKSITSDNTDQVSKLEQPSKHDSLDDYDVDDPMKEFERILSDMAAKNEPVYKKDRPAPLFWENRSNAKSDNFLKQLSPELLFECGPRSSAFSAGKLVGDSAQISPLAARIRKQSGIHKEDKLPIKNKAGAKTRRGITEFAGGKVDKRDMELEQRLLNRLANCTSVPKLTNFVISEIEGDNIAKVKGIVDALPSPVVYAELIRKARELQVPEIAFYVYNRCRNTLDVINKLRVMNADVYEELLTTAWATQQDFTAAAFIIQDAISMGVNVSSRMMRYIDQIIVELEKVYGMPTLANKFTVLKGKANSQ
ncbi:hypothetical protein GGI25_001838 [Coemansia spiralis]|uniref:Mtf2-like C-terminal domain-containing protein n=2 Tax=Coemansia TaxID=4863 RepID=A0A9W8GBE0_9FUNG|nr:hypothetical protein BX070DRAFT_225362 [Coemansia spiralis]KAJ1993956.1 hypothetical protein EDC05_001867 [Coemansia umbellata]KAJ2622721.1 hypothetical protein GGI26_002990 [Coemansia sp. RSA 1358]KAJ2679066.1 hypothetical protein GGI25_001838 [Coemansia spiralis]